MRLSAAAIGLTALAAACAPVPPPMPPAPVSVPVPVSINAAPGTVLKATYAVPVTPPVAPAVVGLHGCSGPWEARDGQWRDLLMRDGHPSVWPDSFGSRGLRSQCGERNRAVTAGGARRADAVAAVEWLVHQPYTPAGGVVVMGWSDGGSTVMAAARQGVMPPGTVRGFVAFYPGCRGDAAKPDWAPSAPILIVMGESDDWTPIAPCRALAARFPDRIRLIAYPGAYHDFDAPDSPVRTRRGIAYGTRGDGTAHAGTNPEARAAAFREIPAWIAALPPAS